MQVCMRYALSFQMSISNKLEQIQNDGIKFGKVITVMAGIMHESATVISRSFSISTVICLLIKEKSGMLKSFLSHSKTSEFTPSLKVP